MENLATKTAKRKVKRTLRSVNGNQTTIEDKIRRRAFEIYLDDSDESDDLENWFRAEREIKGFRK